MMELRHLFNQADEILVGIADKKIEVKSVVQYIRANFSKSVLDIYYEAGKLSAEQVVLLNTKTPQVKFSMDSLLKNRINHPELCFIEYEKIGEIITNPDEVKLSKGKRNSILLFRKYGKTYQVVIKTTLSGEENFLTSFRLAEH